jgi:hypothetical protein
MIIEGFPRIPRMQGGTTMGWEISTQQNKMKKTTFLNSNKIKPNQFETIVWNIQQDKPNQFWTLVWNIQQNKQNQF